LALGALAWLAVGWYGDPTAALRGWVTTCAVHLACQNYTTRRFVSRSQRPGAGRWQACWKAVVWVLLPGFACSGWDIALPAASVLAVLAVPFGLWVFRRAMGEPTDYPNNRKRWLIQGAAAFGVSLPAGGIGIMLGI